MAISLKIKRGTRAQLTAAANSGSLLAGEPYLVTDEGRFAIGLSGSSFEAFAKQSEVGTGGNINRDYGLVSSQPSSSADYGSIV